MDLVILHRLEDVIKFNSAGKMNHRRIQPETRLVDLDFSNHHKSDLVEGIDNEFNIFFEEEIFDHCETVADVVAMIEKKMIMPTGY